jgi:hypothetical protein
MQMKLLGIIIVDFDITDELLIRYSAFVRYWIRNVNKWDSTPAVYRLQESIFFSEERNIIQYAH